MWGLGDWLSASKPKNSEDVGTRKAIIEDVKTMILKFCNFCTSLHTNIRQDDTSRGEHVTQADDKQITHGGKFDIRNHGVGQTTKISFRNRKKHEKGRNASKIIGTCHRHKSFTSEMEMSNGIAATSSPTTQMSSSMSPMKSTEITTDGYHASQTPIQLISSTLSEFAKRMSFTLSSLSGTTLQSSVDDDRFPKMFEKCLICRQNGCNGTVSSCPAIMKSHSNNENTCSNDRQIDLSNNKNVIDHQQQQHHHHHRSKCHNCHLSNCNCCSRKFNPTNISNCQNDSICSSSNSWRCQRMTSDVTTSDSFCRIDRNLIAKLSPSESVSVNRVQNASYGRCNVKKRTSTKILFSYVMWLITLFLVNATVSMMVTGVSANETGLSTRSEICRSMDIRNRPSEFLNLTGCRVVEGFLMISLMDKYDSSDYDNLTFPLLTEITDYLIVYRINGLRSLGKLFPNLSVIRGNNRFEAYSLVIYENMQLEELALKSLTHIKRGGVRIEKNPLLCFVNTIDWLKIAHNTTMENHFFKENKLINECPTCPGEKTPKYDRSESPYEVADPHMPICNITQGDTRLCWNRQNCQKICPEYCGNRSCNNRGQCCDDSCLGSCYDENVNQCTVCKDLAIGDYQHQRCTKECPPGYYRYMERRCISAQECRAMPKPLNVDTPEESSFIPFGEVCSTSCPVGFEKYNNETCRPCQGRCIKKCSAGQIDNISAAKRLRGCTIITGPLIISIRQGGSYVIDELQTSLSGIEEIQGYLKITRSYSLVSLSFLKGLKYIRGNTLETNKYAFYVLDNQNLQNLFNDNQTVSIDRGKIFFHFNPKLCYYKIEKLRPMIRDNETFDKADVARDSNGDRIACNITELTANVFKIDSRAVVVKVRPMEFDDARVFLGYQYFYIEAQHQNVSIYESRHGCGNDAWTVDDDTTKEEYHLFSHLKPYTQYAFYVKTYTIASEQNGGQSKIQYFRTLPDKPESVRNLRSITNGSSEIVLEWDPPRIPNGKLTHYKIRAVLSYDDSNLLEQRNYCSEPIKIVNVDRPDVKKLDDHAKVDKDCDCDHDNQGNRAQIEESEVENVIEFEDAIQNFVYIKREDTSSGERRSDDKRSKRDLKFDKAIKRLVSRDEEVIPSYRRYRRDADLGDTLSSEPPNKSNDQDVFPNDRAKNSKRLEAMQDDVNEKEGDYFVKFSKVVNVSVTMYVLTSLKHYSSYTIGVRACREGNGTNCSNEIMINGRTLKVECDAYLAKRKAEREKARLKQMSKRQACPPWPLRLFTFNRKYCYPLEREIGDYKSSSKIKL